MAVSITSFLLYDFIKTTALLFKAEPPQSLFEYFPFVAAIAAGWATHTAPRRWLAMPLSLTPLVTAGASAFCAHRRGFAPPFLTAAAASLARRIHVAAFITTVPHLKVDREARSPA